MRKFLLAFTLLLGGYAMNAQDESTTNWKLGADINSTFFQTAFVNWTEGGENAITLGILGNGSAKYKKDKLSWNNNVLLQYSIQRIGDNTNDFTKNIDKFEILSLAGYQATEKLDYSMLFSLKTQLTNTTSVTDSTSTLLSTIFAPAEILIGPGMKYAYGDKKTKSQLALNFSPATAKFTIVSNQDVLDNGVFKERMEFGASLIGMYRVNLTDNITYITNGELFMDYLGREDNTPRALDVKWMHIINMKVWKIVTLTFSADIRYDVDILDKVRFAETFGVGIGYKFTN